MKIIFLTREGYNLPGGEDEGRCQGLSDAGGDVLEAYLPVDGIRKLEYN